MKKYISHRKGKSLIEEYGIERAEEIRQKMSDARKGRIPYNKGKKGLQKANKTSYKKGQRAKNWNGFKKGNKPWNAELKGTYSIKHKGQFTTEKVSGEKNNRWKGGITPINFKIRNSKKYKLWRTAVFERDNYTCVWCSKKGGRLNADHIKPFALFPKLRFVINNGRTLCYDCHKTCKTRLKISDF